MRTAARIERKATTGLALVSQARQLFFEEGTLPSGLVNDAVWRSWQRGASGGSRAGDTVPFNPVRGNGVAELLEINRHLISAAQPTFRRLEQAFRGSEYGLLLTDRTGMGVAVHGLIDKCGKLLRQALRPGVDLSERSIGTNAMAAAIAEERAVAVLGAEHYFVQNSTFQCVAARRRCRRRSRSSRPSGSCRSSRWRPGRMHAWCPLSVGSVGACQARCCCATYRKDVPIRTSRAEKSKPLIMRSFLLGAERGGRRVGGPVSQVEPGCRKLRHAGRMDQ